MGVNTARQRWEPVARFIHDIHGTRSLAVTILLLAVLSLAEPALPPDWPAWVVTVPLASLAAIGLATLAREAVATQLRLRRLTEDPACRLLLQVDLLYPLALVILLAPRVFLAAYGVPHMSPWTGLVSTALQQRIATTYMFALLLIPILHLRRARRYAPQIVPLRPRDLGPEDLLHNQRDLVLLLQGGIVVAWLALLWPFWGPIDPAAGVRGIDRIVFAVFLPTILFVHATAHAQAWYRLAKVGGPKSAMALLAAHIVLGLVAAALHVYAMLWIVRYQALSLL